MSNYDPEIEIDPTIRLEEEELVRQAEEQRQKEEQHREMIRTINEVLDQRERREIERRDSERAVRRERYSDRERHSAVVEEPTRESVAPDEDEQTQSEVESRPRKRKQSKSVKTARELLSGHILDTPWMRRNYPYLIGFGVMILLYLMSSFGVQRMNHTHQVLERRLRTVRTEAVNMSAKAKSVSSRSAVARRIKELGLDLEESTKPVKVIEQ